MASGPNLGIGEMPSIQILLHYGKWRGREKTGSASDTSSKAEENEICCNNMYESQVQVLPGKLLG